MSGQVKVALVGDIALNLIAPYFSEAGFTVYAPSGFGTWRQELLDSESGLNRFRPDYVFELTKYDEVLSREVPNFYDERMRTLASMPYSLAGIKALVEELEFLVAAKGGGKKLLAVDADNTLWQGILSEDGASALKPYNEFQAELKALSKAGVALVLLSKNDPFEFRADMQLKLTDFAATKVNWAPKAGNLIEVCKTLNLGLDSVVFIDDNPHERAQMSAHLPEVVVVPFPDDLSRPQSFIRRLKTYCFSTIGVTQEDQLRMADYQSKARELARQYNDVGDYLTGLGLTVIPRLATSADVERLAQMAGKTNQFNATTIRRTKVEISELLNDSNKRVFVFDASDKFVHQGIVLYVIVDLSTKRVTDFVMSCRAMGRTLEYFAYNFIIKTLGFTPAIDFVKTAKNCPFADFLRTINGEHKTYYREA